MGSSEMTDMATRRWERMQRRSCVANGHEIGFMVGSCWRWRHRWEGIPGKEIRCGFDRVKERAVVPLARRRGRSWMCTVSSSSSSEEDEEDNESVKEVPAPASSSARSSWSPPRKSAEGGKSDDTAPDTSGTEDATASASGDAALQSSSSSIQRRRTKKKAAKSKTTVGTEGGGGAVRADADAARASEDAALSSSSSSSLQGRWELEDELKWETEASLLKDARVQHRFFPYLSAADDTGDDPAMEQPERRLFICSGSGSNRVAQVESGRLRGSTGKELKDAVAIWTMEKGVGLGTLKRRFYGDGSNVGVPVLVGCTSGAVIAAASIDLASVTGGIVDELLRSIVEEAGVRKKDLRAAIGADQRFVRPVVVTSGLVNTMFLTWDDNVPLGNKRKIFFVHKRQEGGGSSTEVIARSKKNSKGPLVKLALRSPLSPEMWFINVQEVVAERLRLRGVDQVEVLSPTDPFVPQVEDGFSFFQLKAESDEDDAEDIYTSRQLAALIAS